MEFYVELLLVVLTHKNKLKSKFNHVRILNDLVLFTSITCTVSFYAFLIT